MSTLRSKYGKTEEEAIADSIEEAHSDVVGLWTMIHEGQNLFGLGGDELVGFVRRHVIAMIDAGADPVVGDRAARSGWRPLPASGQPAEQVADCLLADWLQTGKVPDIDGPWFAFPRVWRRD